MPGKGRGQAVAAAAKKGVKPAGAVAAVGTVAYGVQKTTSGGSTSPTASGTAATGSGGGGLIPALPMDLILPLLGALFLVGLVFLFID